jgi:serine phosphatase RsbU (regulator of sigma subunit)
MALVFACCVLAAGCIASAVAAPNRVRLTPAVRAGKTAGGSPAASPADPRQVGGRIGTPGGHEQDSANRGSRGTGNHALQEPASQEQQPPANHEHNRGGHEQPASGRGSGSEERDPGSDGRQQVRGGEVKASGGEGSGAGRKQQSAAGHEQRDHERTSHKQAGHGQAGREQSSQGQISDGQSSHGQTGHERTGRERSSQEQTKAGHERTGHEQSGHEQVSHEQTSHAQASHEQTSHEQAGDERKNVRGVSEQGDHERTSTPSARPTGVASPGSAVISPPLTLTPAAVTTTPSLITAAPQAPGVSSPTIVRTLPQALHGRRAHTQAASGGVARRSGRGARSGTSPRGVALAPEIGPIPTRVASVVRRHRRVRGSLTQGRPSPIVTTITRIVAVVPSAVWILIGALLALALGMAVRSRFVALRARRLESQRRELLEDVGLLQAALLPIAPARLGPVGTSVAYRPAEGPGAGGDFYDVFALDDGRLAVIVGDVSGHGRQALPHTALIRFTLRAYLEAGFSPRSAMQTAGVVLERQLDGSFATVVAAIYHPRDRTLSYACAGHPPPIVRGSNSIEPITVCSSPPIAVGMRTGTRQTVVSVPGWSQVCLYTDGVTEARVGSELYGAERLAGALAELGPRATASALLQRVTEETSARPDDMAACLLSVEGGDGAPKVLVEEIEFDHDELADDRMERFLLACGVERQDLAELIRSARTVAGRVGAVVLELDFSDGSPEVALRRDKVALLQKPHVRPRADASVSR